MIRKNPALTKAQDEKGAELIKKGLLALQQKKFEDAKEYIVKAETYYKKFKALKQISICLSILGFTEYMLDKDNMEIALGLIEDGHYMAELSGESTAKLFYEFCLGSLDYCEGQKDTALMHYQNARNYAMKSDGFALLGYITARINQLQSGNDIEFPIQSDPLVSLVKIGRSINVLTDINVLLKVIAEETKIAMQADRCTVFLYDKEKNEIWSKVALGLDSKEIRFPADKGLAGYVVKTGESVNIQDAYTDPRFNPEVDKETGYKTKTILCMPIKNNNQEIIGAFQVLNKKKGTFTKSDEDLLVAIGGSASITLENAQLFKQQQEMYKEQKLLFDSFINTLAASIDARDKITSGHSDRVRLYSMLIVDALGLDEKQKEIIEKAAILHDIGKIGIRDSVLQKEGKLTAEEYKHIQEHVQITHNILEKIYKTEDFKQIDEIACSHHEKYDGSGYFRHLKGEEIPYGGRILAVSDVFDAITSRRHYRDKMPIENVVGILIKDSGTHFDKSIVDVFLNEISVDKIVKVFLTENHSDFKEDDKKILEKYHLIDIYNYINKEKPTKKEQQIVKIFNSYYSTHTENHGNE